MKKKSILTLHHGSDHVIEKPVYGLGNPKNDYGLGFYCTEHFDLAAEWACTADKNGFVNDYEVDTGSLDTLYLTRGDYHILNWMAILISNRSFVLDTPIRQQGYDYITAHFLPDYKKHDAIIGYRADDSYFSFARAFLSNEITLEQLSYSMQLGHLGEQVVLCSKEAFDQISFVGHTPVNRWQYYPQKKARDDLAREKYKKMLLDTSIAGHYLVDIIRGKWEDDDERLQHIIFK